MHLTVENLAATYTLLLTCKPFRNWKMPPAEQVSFRVTRDRHYCGQYGVDGKEHQIDISARRCTHITTMMQTMAHEMLHLAQRVRKRETNNTQHNFDFIASAARISMELGFDPGDF